MTRDPSFSDVTNRNTIQKLHLVTQRMGKVTFRDVSMSKVTFSDGTLKHIQLVIVPYSDVIHGAGQIHSVTSFMKL